MQIDASDVFQPMNPGDALIRKYTAIRAAPDNHRWAVLDGLKLVAKSDFGEHRIPIFLIEIHNAGSAVVDSSEIGPTLLGPTRATPFAASGDDSVALITRGDVLHPSSWESMVGNVKSSAKYRVDPKTRPPERFQLEPGKSMKVRLTFKLSSGQYQLIFGYGGGVHEEKSLASNAISFDVSDKGIATLAQ
jgi:hypothetical protein